MPRSPQQRRNRMDQPPLTATRGRVIGIDTTNMYRAAVGEQGLDIDALASIAEDLRRVHALVVERSKGGLDASYAPLNLGAEMPAHVNDVQRLAVEMRDFDELIVIGIGGSSLGAKAVWHALRASLRSSPRLHFVENVDPFDLQYLLDQINPKDTAVVCISKSGGTIETVVQYLVIREWLTEHLGKQAREHQWVVTDPEHGWLRELADAESLPSLPVPPQVGGRFSVLSAVGLLPLAAIDVDISRLLEGAAENAARCNADVVEENPALLMAALYYLLDVRKGKRISVMMPYINRLRLFVDWYCQLWAESLGKNRGPGEEPAGTLPVRAMGAVDQHSQLQMYLESRHDKMFTFLELEHWEHDFKIPIPPTATERFSYLQDKALSDVIQAEFRATRRIITETGHPNLTITMPSLDAHTLGQLIDLYQRITIYTALLYGVNPIDQPAVEKGKKLAVDYLSRM